MRRFSLLSTVLLVVFAASGCSTFRSFERTTSRLFFPASVESSMGNQYHEQIVQEFEIVSDPVVQEWVSTVGQQLVATSPETSQDFDFFVTGAKEVNAFAVPGGYCYINTGLILYAENEAQVVAVVGHEINHVTTRHGMLQLQRQMGLQLVTYGVTSFFSSAAAQAAAAIGSQAGGYLTIRKFGRDDEREADRLGIEAMYEAGWDPREGAEFFRKLNALSGGATPGMLQQLVSTHPPTIERVENIEEQIQEYDLTIPLTVTRPEFERVQAILRDKFGTLDIDQPATVQEAAALRAATGCGVWCSSHPGVPGASLPHPIGLAKLFP